MLDVLAGYEVGDATWAPPPERAIRRRRRDDRRPGRASCGSQPRRCRRFPTRWSTRWRRGAVDEAAELLRELGHEVEEVDPPWQIDGVSELFGAVFCTHIGLVDRLLGNGRRP